MEAALAERAERPGPPPPCEGLSHQPLGDNQRVTLLGAWRATGAAQGDARTGSPRSRDPRSEGVDDGGPGGTPSTREVTRAPASCQGSTLLLEAAQPGAVISLCIISRADGHPAKTETKPGTMAVVPQGARPQPTTTAALALRGLGTPTGALCVPPGCHPVPWEGTACTCDSTEGTPASAHWMSPWHPEPIPAVGSELPIHEGCASPRALHCSGVGWDGEPGGGLQHSSPLTRLQEAPWSRAHSRWSL